MVLILHQKNTNGNNARLFDGVAEATGRPWIAHLRYEDDERGSAEDGRSTVATHIGTNDHKPADGNVDRNDGNLCSAVIIGYNGDDRLLRLSRTIDTLTGH